MDGLWYNYTVSISDIARFVTESSQTGVVFLDSLKSQWELNGYLAAFVLLYPAMLCRILPSPPIFCWLAARSFSKVYFFVKGSRPLHFGGTRY